ncbi:hypothetical protein CHS0354_019948 [Potamilus streckersoni]|uniref:Uncharacterized protein n=1 Tax=Potamilus streckersoni TaxID=2493646 RepID=A0AAE0S0C2_9BIVA|nr:hypothetical protein CHS0354_019948 [Potamilus streckersoni]
MKYIVDMDGGYYLRQCTCYTPLHHHGIPCKQFAIPVRSHFASDKGYMCSEELDIKQKKGIARAIEMRYDEDKIAVILSFSLSSGVSDFIPKCYGTSHEKWLKGIFENETFRRNLFKIRSIPGSVHLSVNIVQGYYTSLQKSLSCRSKHDANIRSLDEVRQLRIKLPGKYVRSPKLWMPPVTVFIVQAETRSLKR